MSIDILYTARNRLEYVQRTFHAMIEHTDWGNVTVLRIIDDGSEDGTREWLEETVPTLRIRCGIELHTQPVGGPVAAMNWLLDQRGANVFAKIDSDCHLCPRWLDEALHAMHLNPGLDLLGIMPMYGPPVMPNAPREIEPASHIGGVGLIRRRAFEGCRPVADGRFGWTAWQERHPAIARAWLRPDMPTFELDRLPIEPWRSLAELYVDKGWARAWSPYTDDMSGYWDWAFPS